MSTRAHPGQSLVGINETQTRTLALTLIIRPLKLSILYVQLILFLKQMRLQFTQGGNRHTNFLSNKIHSFCCEDNRRYS